MHVGHGRDVGMLLEDLGVAAEPAAAGLSEVNGAVEAEDERLERAVPLERPRVVQRNELALAGNAFNEPDRAVGRDGAGLAKDLKREICLFGGFRDEFRGLTAQVPVP